VTGWAALATALAVWLWLSPPADLRRLAGRSPRAGPTSRGWAGWLTAGAVGVIAAGTGGWAIGVAAGCLTATATWMTRRRRRRRTASGQSAEVVRACELLGGMLGLGQVPTTALRAAAQQAPVLAEAAAVQALGGEVPVVLRRAAAGPGSGGLAEIAAAWEVAERTGASLTATVTAVSDRLTADQTLRATVEAELSAPRATGRLLAVLPVAGIALGYLMGGDPVAFLTGSAFGQACLAAGAALGCAGLIWTELLADRYGA